MSDWRIKKTVKRTAKYVIMISEYNISGQVFLKVAK